MFHPMSSCYSTGGTLEGATGGQTAYCYENETDQVGRQNQVIVHGATMVEQGGASYETGPATSSEFASVFATLYSAPPQMTQNTISGNFVGNQETFYPSNYYSVQPGGIMMHQGQSVSPTTAMGSMQPSGFGYSVDYSSYNPTGQQQLSQLSQQEVDAGDNCYLGGNRDNSACQKSEYLIMKEQREATNLSHFYMERCTMRQAVVEEGIKEVMPVVQTLLKDVEQQEPRFVYQLMSDGTEDNTTLLGRPMGENDLSQVKKLPNGMWQRIPSFRTISTHEFQIILFLNQMAVFNCIDDGSLPGYAALKLCDGRKRSMSLWVEFITASGYLSAKKLRSRFHALLMTAVEKQYASAPHIARFNQSNGSLVIYNKYIVSIVPGFRCRGCWPASARNLSSLPGGSAALYVNGDGSKPPMNGTSPDGQTLIGFTLIANEVNTNGSQANGQAPNNGGASSSYNNKDNGLATLDANAQQQRRPSASADSDTWQINVFEAEGNLLNTSGVSGSGSYANIPGEMPLSGRVACFRTLKTLRDHVEGLGGITNHQLATLVLWEWEKHPNSSDWLTTSLPDRIRSILLQLINCLQNQRLDHYLLANVNILSETPNGCSNGSQHSNYTLMARKIWQLLRQLTFNFNEINRLV